MNSRIFKSLNLKFLNINQTVRFSLWKNLYSLKLFSKSEFNKSLSLLSLCGLKRLFCN